MNKLFLALTALAFSFGTLTARAETVHFDSGSAKVHRGHVEKHKHKHKQKHKHKVWVPAHRSNGHLVPGHYVWRR
ncbi:MAG: hypothetical protein H7255_20975 [Ramlibacter sp.]|nr:hypothetical protein [Ramlibacter sp.]